MLKTACFEIAAISPSFIQSYLSIVLSKEKVGFKINRHFSCFDDVINKMFTFLTNKVPFFSYISNVLLF